MKIAFIYFNQDKNINMGAGYIATLIKYAGYDLKFIDTAYWSDDRIFIELKSVHYDIIVMSVSTLFYSKARKMSAFIKKSINPQIKILMGGIHSIIEREKVLKENDSVDYICVGEGEDFILEFLKMYGRGSLYEINNLGYRDINNQICINKLNPPTDITKLPPFQYDLFEPTSIVANPPLSPLPGFCYVFATRGCPFTCVTGDTKVTTVEGDIPIKDLVGKEIGVLTYNIQNKEVFFSKAINIRAVGIKKIVRVSFDDGTYIDCTPDHKFLTFKNGNQFVDLLETPKEAKDLFVGESIRAFRREIPEDGHNIITWARRSRKRLNRLIMEYFLGRKLDKKEIVHHKDKNKLNDKPDNLILCANAKEHINKFHPEVSERIKLNNPRKYRTAESFKSAGLKMRGIKRGLETRKKMRENQLGKNNSNYRNGNYSGKESRIKEINHKVVKIEVVGSEEVYDLEVPETGWFFANNVLIHNCHYCNNSTYLNIYKKDYLRKRNIDDIINELQYLKEKYEIKIFYFGDEMIYFDEQYCGELFKRIKNEINIPYGCMVRVEKVNAKLVELFKTTGCKYVGMGLECGNEKFRKDYLNRWMSNEQIISAFKMLREVPGVMLTSYNMTNYPVAYDDQLTESTLQLNSIIKPDIVQISKFFPFPGTVLYTYCDKHDLIDKEKWEKMSDCFTSSVLKEIKK